MRFWRKRREKLSVHVRVTDEYVMVENESDHDIAIYRILGSPVDGEAFTISNTDRGVRVNAVGGSYQWPRGEQSQERMG